ncbi:MAG: alpha-glucan family phosphorylase, partial [Candidatus Nanohalobium sp.]
MSRQISYFTMEIGLEPEIKTYSGGLGVLAGDTVKAAADHDLDFTAVTLLYREGYFRQVIEDEEQQEKPQEWDFNDRLEDTGEKISLRLRDRHVDVKIWRYTVEGEEGDAEVLFLDTGLESNHEEDRKLTSRLYMGGSETRLCQEAVLGIGGVKALREVDRDPDYYHMNEGHSALLVTEASGKKVFTTHTPVPAGHDTFSDELIRKVLPEDKYASLDFGDELNMTEVALENSSYKNAVSDRHKQVTENMFPDYEVDAVTNGVHTRTWTSEQFKKLYDEKINRWCLDPARLTKAEGLKDNEVWKAKKEAKRELKEFIEDENGEQIDLETFTVGFARRSTSYKRPTLIFRDLDRLRKLAEQHGGLQLIFAGKAHPDDEEGKKLVSEILRYSDILDEVKVVFIEDYGMDAAKKMASGVDLWLNNPERGQEASGTSGMKAALNGTPQLSTPDGWWLEGHIEGVT